MSSANPSASPAVLPAGSQVDYVAVSARLAALESDILDAYDNAPFGSHGVGADGKFLNINSVELRWLGRDRDELIGKLMPAEFLSAGSRDVFEQKCLEAGHGGLQALELELLSSNGTSHSISLSSSSVRDANGRPRAYRAILFNFVDRNVARDHQHIAAIAFEALTGICVTDKAGTILLVNGAFTRLTGYSTSEVKSRNMSLLSSGRHDRAFFQAMWGTIRSTGGWQGEIYNRRKSGEIYAGWLSVSSIMDDDGNTTHYVGSFSDITASKVAQAEVTWLAFFDSLTQLPNRRLLLDRLGMTLLALRRSKQQGALLFIDLDNFKTINDTRGHDAGDRLLIEAGQRLRRQVRACDTVARLGGDEFVVLLSDLGAQADECSHLASTVAHKLLAMLAEPFTFDDFDYACGASIGICMLTGDETVSTVLQQADLAMYQAKRGGRNTWRFFNPTMQSTVTAHMALGQELGNALRRKQFHMYYQPQVDQAGHVVGAEALLRWRNSLGNWVSPAQFIPVAEESDLILAIGQFVLESACTQLRIWQDDPRTSGIVLAVNISARQLMQPDFVAQVWHELAHSNANPARLKLELTESMVLDAADTRTKMAALGDIGVLFAMDDFGTGYSSLSSLTKLPLHELKIDLSFVQALEHSAADAIVVQTIIGMAHSLGLQVIAEGVETLAQRDFLQAHGCGVCQGYLYAPALALEDFEQLVHAGLSMNRFAPDGELAPPSASPT